MGEEKLGKLGVGVLGDMDLVLGMKLAGANKSLVFDSEKAKEQVKTLSDYEIVIVTEEIAVSLKEKGLFEEFTGSVVQVPDRFGSKGLAVKGVSQLFEDALGIKIEGDE